MIVRVCISLLVLFGLLAVPDVHAGPAAGEAGAEVAPDAAFLRRLDSMKDDLGRESLIESFATTPSAGVRVTLEAIALDARRRSGIRMLALCSLEHSATGRSVPVLLKILEADLEERHGFWGCAIPLLAGLRDRRAVPLLLRIAEGEGDPPDGMRLMAIEALARLGDEREVSFLAGKAHIVPVRLAVMRGLARIASVRSVGTFIDALQGAEDPEVAGAAEEGLRRIGARALPELRAALAELERNREHRDEIMKSRLRKLVAGITHARR